MKAEHEKANIRRLLEDEIIDLGDIIEIEGKKFLVDDPATSFYGAPVHAFPSPFCPFTIIVWRKVE